MLCDAFTFFIFFTCYGITSTSSHELSLLSLFFSYNDIEETKQ